VGFNLNLPGVRCGSCLCIQHPDIVEKRRKAFGDNLRTYLAAAQKVDAGSQGNGVESNRLAEDGDVEGEGVVGGYSLRRRTTPS